MKKITLFLLFYFLFTHCFSNNNLNINLEIRSLDSTQTNHQEPLKKLFEKGIQEYSNYNYDKAIHIWKAVLQKTNKKKDSALIIRSNINIGSSYNALGYHKTALNYFLRTNKILEQYQKKNEAYWVNHINIGVCYMSLEQYDLAKSFFDKTIAYTPYVGFVKKLNLAKWNAIQENRDKFYELQSEVSKLVVQYPMYESIWEELQMDFLIKWKDTLRLKDLIAKQLPFYSQKNLYLRLQINQASLLFYKKTVEPITAIIKYEQEVLDSNDFFLKEIYYEVLKEFYYQSNNLKQFYKYNQLSQENYDQQAKEKNMLYVEDQRASQEIEELKTQFNNIQLKNKLIQNRLLQSNMMLGFTIVIVIMGLGIIFLLIRNFRKNKKIHSLNILKSQNELLKNEFEKVALSESLKETAEELNTSVLNIKKVALLKKQLENIVDEKNPSYNEKETLKRLKLCLNSFFDNYRELTQIMQRKLNVDKIVDFVKKEYPEVTSKEIVVIEYIALQFTTKEIALLMDKSEKTIEYYRSQIRKKLNLTANNTLEEYLNALIKM